VLWTPGKDTVDGFQFLPLFAHSPFLKVEVPGDRAFPLLSRTGEEVGDKWDKSHANNQTRAGLYTARDKSLSNPFGFLVHHCEHRVGDKDSATPSKPPVSLIAAFIHEIPYNPTDNLVRKLLNIFGVAALTQ